MVSSHLQSLVGLHSGQPPLRPLLRDDARCEVVQGSALGSRVGASQFWRRALARADKMESFGPSRKSPSSRLCASMADVVDNEVAQAPRLWEVVRPTPNLAWLLLTKPI